MAKVIDITDKLTFDENPRIKVKGIEIELNANALNLIDIIRTTQEDSSPSNVAAVIEKIFANPDDIEKIRPLNLSMKGLVALYTECVNVIVGAAGDNEGETQTPATT